MIGSSSIEKSALSLSIGHLLEPITDERIRRYVELRTIQQMANGSKKYTLLRSVNRILTGFQNPVQELFDEYDQVLKNLPQNEENIAKQAATIEALGDTITEILQDAIEKMEALEDQLESQEIEEEESTGAEQLQTEYQSLTYILQSLFTGIKVTEEDVNLS
jgi:septal ring factor EnvC (AmiA/AmiB activator)